MAHSRLARAVSQIGTLFGFVVFGGIGAGDPLFAQDSGADPQRIFRARADELAQFEPDPLSLRSRAVDVALDDVASQDALVLDLFDGVACVAFRETSRPSWLPVDAWVGRVPGEPSSIVNLVVRDGIVVGTIRLGGALYKIRPIGDARGVAAIEEIDEFRFPSCAVEREQEVHGAGGHAIDTATAATGALALTAPISIDVLVVYTPQAKTGAGSATAMDTLIDLAVLEANQSYVNSAANLRLNLVYKGEVAYTESNNFSTDLARLQNPADGFMDSVHALRDSLHADMVSLIVNASSSCGIGYVMTGANSSFQNYAFSAVARTCATGYYSFAHELGHNFGCQHDRQSGGTGVFPYSFGYRNPAGTWRTVMAYPPGTRIPFFSNPAVSYQGEPTGVVSTSTLGCDNAKTMNLTAPVVAAFRAAATTAPNASVYGQGKLTSRGERPTLTPLGVPTVSGAGFQLKLEHAISNSNGFVHMSSQQANAPFQGGMLYAALPLVHWVDYRAALDGSAVVSMPMTASVVGQTYYYQALFRDIRHPDHTGTGLSNGVQVTYGP